jgi:hypothetical protein
MKIKTLIVIIGALAALSIAVFIARRPDASPASDPRIGKPVADAAQIEKAARIRISDQGKTVTLARTSDGSWQVENYHGLPADFSKLSQLVSNLSEAKLTRFVSARPEIISRLEFNDTKIELLEDGAKEPWSVTLGKSADTGGRYVRFGAETKAYLASLSLWLDTEQKNWADSRLVTLKAEDVSSVEIPFADESPVVLTRAKSEDPWTAAKLPDGQKVNAGKVTSLLSSLTQLRFSDTAAPDDANALAARPHTRTLKIATFNGKTYTLSFARKPEEKKLKTPAAVAGGTPDFTKNSPVNPDGTVKPIDPAKPELPEFETIPAGPVFVSIASSDEQAPVNAWMRKRSFQVAEYVFTGLPQKPAELFEAAPPAPAPVAPSADPAGKP